MESSTEMGIQCYVSAAIINNTPTCCNDDNSATNGGQTEVLPPTPIVLPAAPGERDGIADESQYTGGDGFQASSLYRMPDHRGCPHYSLVIQNIHDDTSDDNSDDAGSDSGMSINTSRATIGSTEFLTRCPSPSEKSSASTRNDVTDKLGEVVSGSSIRDKNDDVNTESDEEVGSLSSTSTVVETNAATEISRYRMTPEQPYDPRSYEGHYFRIQVSPIGGLGAFAVRNIKRGTIIHHEKALFHATGQNLYDEIDKLHPERRKAYYQLHAHFESPRTDLATAILRTNGFQSQRGLSIFLVASRFNNACPPRNSVAFDYDKASQHIILKARTNIPAGKELTVYYGGDPRTNFLKWGFRCGCGACVPLTDEQCEEITSSRLNWG